MKWFNWSDLKEVIKMKWLKWSDWNEGILIVSLRYIDLNELSRTMFECFCTNNLLRFMCVAKRKVNLWSSSLFVCVSMCVSLSGMHILQVGPFSSYSQKGPKAYFLPPHPAHWALTIHLLIKVFLDFRLCSLVSD